MDMDDSDGEVMATNEALINRGTSDCLQPLLQFHSVHGENVSLSQGAKVAQRARSFCKGVVFTNRPILVNEVVCVKLTEVENAWSGVLRFGVTNVDPASFRDIELPKFACPDLTCQGGFWCKALPERFSVQNRVLHFVVDQDGNLNYGINGVNRGIFISKINIHGQLWALFDIYGNSRTIEFLDTTNRSEPLFTRPVGVRALADPLIELSESNDDEDEDDEDRLKFHAVHSASVHVSHFGREAHRMGTDFCQAYVFSNRPVRPGEKMSLLILEHDASFNGSMAFGLTSCDPATLDSVQDLPRDSDNLLDRPEYWTCIKNVAVNPRHRETATFWVEESGEVMFSKNNHEARTIMFVDTSVPLWMFFDLYGSTVKLRATTEQEMASRPRLPLSQSPNELAVVTPPRRSSSTDVNRLLQEMTSLRVQLPPLDGAAATTTTTTTSGAAGSARSAPSSARRTPLLEHDSSGDSTDQNLLNESLLSDISESLQSIRDRTRRFREAQRALEMEQEQLAQLSSLRSTAPYSHTRRAREGSATDPETTPPRRTRPHPNSYSDDRNVIPPLRLNFGALDNNISLGPLSDYSSLDRPRSSSQTRSSPVFRPSASTYSSAASAAPSTSLAAVPSTSVPSSTALSATAALQAAFPLTHRYLTEPGPLGAPAPALAPPGTGGTPAAPPRPTPEAGASAAGTGCAASSVNDDSGAGAGPGVGAECVICMNDRVNAVLYRCGHLCMCFACAREMMNSGKNCPLCRQLIYDVIRCYSA